MKTLKRLVGAVLITSSSLAAQATTLNPVQLLNPTGSTSGQAVVSTGASTAPAWGNVPVANVTGAAALTGATFTGDLTVSEPSAALIMNDTSGTGFPQFVYRSSGVNKWIVFDAPSTHLFTVNRYVGGTFQDTPLTISNSSGVVTMTDGITASPITASPISGSTGSFTTLAASSTVSGAGFTTLLSPYALLASPTFTGTVTTAALTATGAITPSQTAGIVGTTTNNNANSGSVGELVFSDIPIASAVSLTSGVVANVTSVSLTAGDWQCWANVQAKSGGSTVTSILNGWLNTASAALPAALETSGFAGSFAPMSAGSQPGFAVGSVRLSVASTTTLFLSVDSSFTTSTLSAYGREECRRVR